MKCPYCAEQIQDEASLCRFCGASREGDAWQAPAQPLPTRRAPGTLNLRVAGALFILSALFEIFSVTSPVPLFGAMRGGPTAWLYHLAFVGLFGWVGVGLWRARRWGLRAIVVTTIVYTLERTVYLLDASARRAELASQSELTRALAVTLDPKVMEELTAMTIGTVVLCWWGFAAYAWWRRAYFEPR